jgi:hypothetical protein
MTFDRILGFAIGTILAGIGFKIGECVFKKAETEITKALEKRKIFSGEEKYKDKFMDPTIVQGSNVLS